MPVLPGGDAANDNRSTGDRPCLRLDLAPDAWSGTAPVVEMVAWIEDGWCGPVEICPAPDPRPMPTGPD
ncbi:MAG: hypothetical protein ACRC67_11300 [Inquilinus sp.]|uniref:hypothetical protein n=1 Tax=Inquilinus sp. TaxID=1932117 RepID=UPI003F377A71